MLYTVNNSYAVAQLSHASGAVWLSCSGGRESVSQRWCQFLFQFSDSTSDTSAGAYRMLSGGEAWKSTKRTNGVCGWLRSLCSTLGWEVKRMSGWTLWKYVTCACQPSAAGDTFTFLNLHVSAHITLKESIFHAYENKVIFGEGAVDYQQINWRWKEKLEHILC